MTHASIPLVYRQLRRWAASPLDSVPDQELLARFIAHGDETAFAALVQRHTGMVLGLCRAILRNRHDAEDIFQAAFLVLARKAGSIRKGASVGSWLYAVAYRLAHKARIRDDIRRQKEQQQSQTPAAHTPMDDATWGELRGVLHEEVSRLPEKYRAAVVLCYWEGRTHEQAAQQLGCARGTVKDRLEAAREMLRNRLARRGLALSAAFFAASLSDGMSSAAVAAELLQATVRGAIHFRHGQLPAGLVSPSAVAFARQTLRAMGLMQLKHGLALVLMLGVLGGAGLAMLRSSTPPVDADDPPAAKAPDASKRQQPRGDRVDEPLPPGAVARLGTLRFRHAERLADLALGAEGKSIVSAAGKRLYVWDRASGQERGRHEGFEVGINCVACSPNEKIIAAGCQDGTIRIVDTATLGEVRRFVAHKDRTAAVVGPGGVQRLLFSSDGRYLISYGQDQALKRWNTDDSGQVLDLGRFKSAWGLALSPDGKTLAAAVEDQNNWSIRLWEIATGKEQKRLTDLKGRPTTVTFAPDGKILALGVGEAEWNKPASIQLWDWADGKMLRTVGKHEGWIGWLAFSADGKQLVSISSADVTARLWDVKTGELLRPIGPDRQAPIFKALYLPDGKTLVSYGQENSLRFWSAATGKEVRTSEAAQSWVGAVSFSPDGRLLATGAADGLIQLWDTATRKEVRRYTHSGYLFALPFSPDGRTLVSAGLFDEDVRLWDTAGGKEVRSIKTPAMFISCLAWSSDGKTLATWNRQDRVIRLWDTNTGKALHQLGPMAGWANAVVFAPDGRTLAVGVADFAQPAPDGKQTMENISLWSAESGKLLRRLKEPASVYSLAYAPDGRTLAAGGLDGSIHLWETVSGQKRQTFKQTEGVTCLAYSPDGKLLATGKNTTYTRLTSNGTTGSIDNTKPPPPRVHVWDVAAAEELTPLEGHQGAITSLMFSPDGKLLASASNDTTVLLWDATRFQVHRPEVVQLPPEQIEALWAELASTDASKAYNARRRLASAKESADFLKQHLQPVVPADAKEVARLLADLDSEQFAAREKAMQELEKFGDRAAGALHAALAKKPSLEVQRRIEQLLEKDQGTESLRVVRALEVLEQMGTPQARELCAKLAGGAAEARLTREAQATLRRWKRDMP